MGEFVRCRFSTSLWIVAFAMIAAPRVVAASQLTIDEAVETALSANPDVAAASHAADAGKSRAPQAATPPDPMFMVDFQQVPIDTTDVSKGTIMYMVDQKIPFPTKLVYGSKAERRAADAAVSRQEATVQEIERRVKRAYLAAWEAQEEAGIERDTLTVLRQDKAMAETAYASLKSPVADPVRAAVQKGEIEGRLAMLEQQRLTAIAELAQLMAQEVSSETKLAAPPPLPATKDPASLVALAKGSRPEIQQAAHDVASQQARVAVAKSQYAPDFTLRWGYMDMPDGMQNAWYGRAGITVPLWSLSKQRFGVRESKAMLARTESMQEATVLRTEADVRSSFARFDAARKTLRIYEGTVVPRARTLLSSSQEAYRTGTGDFLGVIDAVTRLANARVMAVRARADAGIALADLERAVGAPITKELQ